jgi:hypothetical protein
LNFLERTEPGRHFGRDLPIYIRNVEKAKKEKKSWYQYVFLAVAMRSEAAGGRQGEERNAVAGSCAVAAANSLREYMGLL